VPTVTEAGFPALTFEGLAGLFGPRDIARRASASNIRAELNEPALAARLAGAGAAVSPGNAAEFAASLEQQCKTLAAAVKAPGISKGEFGE
jgi:tripartite-type tricarboxylate transporter receptor subunit TctC